MSLCALIICVWHRLFPPSNIFTLAEACRFSSCCLSPVPYSVGFFKSQQPFLPILLKMLSMESLHGSLFLAHRATVRRCFCGWQVWRSSSLPTFADWTKSQSFPQAKIGLAGREQCQCDEWSMLSESDAGFSDATNTWSYSQIRWRWLLCFWQTRPLVQRVCCDPSRTQCFSLCQSV